MLRSPTLRSRSLALLFAVTSVGCLANPEAEPETQEFAAESIADAAKIVRRPDGAFDVTCVDGRTQTGVSAADIAAQKICEPVPACPPLNFDSAFALFPPGSTGIAAGEYQYHSSRRNNNGITQGPWSAWAPDEVLRGVVAFGLDRSALPRRRLKIWFQGKWRTSVQHEVVTLSERAGDIDESGPSFDKIARITVVPGSFSGDSCGYELSFPNVIPNRFINEETRSKVVVTLRRPN